MPITNANHTTHKKPLPFAISPLFLVKTLVLTMSNELKNHQYDLTLFTEISLPPKGF